MSKAARSLRSPVSKYPAGVGLGEVGTRERLPLSLAPILSGLPTTPSFSPRASCFWPANCRTHGPPVTPPALASLPLSSSPAGPGGKHTVCQLIFVQPEIGSALSKFITFNRLLYAADFSVVICKMGARGPPSSMDRWVRRCCRAVGVCWLGDALWTLLPPSRSCVCTRFRMGAVVLRAISRVLVLFCHKILKNRNRGLEFLYFTRSVGRAVEPSVFRWPASCCVPAVSTPAPCAFSVWSLQPARPQRHLQTHACWMMAPVPDSSSPLLGISYYLQTLLWMHVFPDSNLVHLKPSSSCCLFLLNSSFREHDLH